MSNAFVQALLMDDPYTGPTPVNSCVPDAYYSCGPTNDPYWNDVVLMMHMDGTNGGTTFTDSSSFARTITRNGSPTTSTATPKFGSASASISASTQYLTAADSTDLRLDTGDFTIEAWVRIASKTLSKIICTKATGTGAFPYQMWYNVSGDLFAFRVFTSGLTLISLDDSTVGTKALNTYYHLAATRSGNTLRFFVDGILQDTASVSGALYADTDVLTVGAYTDGTFGLDGQIDDLRITKGVARYTGNFIVPTAAYPDALETTWNPAAARTVLSLHAENTNDSSCYQTKVVTLNGTASVSTAEEKFGASSFSITNTGTDTVNGVTILDNQDFDFDAEDFTFDGWAYRTADTYLGTLFYYTEAAEFSFTVNTSGVIIMNYSSSGGAQASINTGVTFPLNTWQYVVVQRRGTNWEMYLHGATPVVTAITGGAGSTVNSSGDLYLGRTNVSSALGWNGYIDEFRLTNGVARYTAAFTPPALLNCNGTTDPDARIPTNGTEYPTGQVLASAQGTITIANPWKKFEGQAATAAAGSVSVYDPNVTRALIGQALTASSGTLTSPPYPDLLSSDGEFTAYTGDPSTAFITVSNDGTVTLSAYNAGSPAGTDLRYWIDTTQTNYSIPAISGQYNIVAGLSGVPISASTDVTQLVAGAAVGNTVLYDISVYIVPTSANPRYGAIGYLSVTRFQFSLTSDAA